MKTDVFGFSFSLSCICRSTQVEVSKCSVSARDKFERSLLSSRRMRAAVFQCTRNVDLN
jgi:hypothetical protein